MSLTSENARRILAAAAAAETGVIVRVQALRPVAAKTIAAKSILGRIRREAVMFHDLKIFLSPTDPDNELWIIHRDKS
jgi:hypothetical protein